jgi:hypothetical protein
LQADHAHSIGRPAVSSGKEADGHFDLDDLSPGGTAKGNATVIGLPLEGSMTCSH